MASFSGYTYSRPITIYHSQVPNTDQTNFPVLISTTLAQLATTSNGGHVQNSSGYDIVFSTMSDCSFLLNWDTETYTASTGNVIAWVKVPTVSHTTDTSLTMCYGNSSVTTYQGNSTGTWDSNFQGVWHLPNGSTLSALDSTNRRVNGTITTPTATTGKVDGAALFNATTDFIGLSTTTLTSGTPLTIEWWENGTSNINTFVSRFALQVSPSLTKYFIATRVGAAQSSNYGDLAWGEAPSAIANPGSPTITLATGVGTWIHFVITGSDPDSEVATNYILYANGVVQTLRQGAAYGTVTQNHIGYDGTDSGANAIMDEVRISNIRRSGDWVSAEYTNQSAPATFYVFGSEASSFPSARILGLSVRGGKLSIVGGKVVVQ